MAQSEIMKIYPYVFFLKLCDLAIRFRSLTHFHCLSYKMWDRGSDFVYLYVEIQLSLHHLLKRLLFPIKWTDHPCQNSVGHKCMGLFLDFSSVSFVYMSIIMPVPHYIDYFSFVLSFRIKKVWVLQICSSFSTLFLPFQNPGNFKWSWGSAFRK